MSFYVYQVDPEGNTWNLVAQVDTLDDAKAAARQALENETTYEVRRVAVIWSAVDQTWLWGMDEDRNERVPEVRPRSAGEGQGLRFDFLGFRD